MAVVALVPTAAGGCPHSTSQRCLDFRIVGQHGFFFRCNQAVLSGSFDAVDDRVACLLDHENHGGRADTGVGAGHEVIVGKSGDHATFVSDGGV